MVRTLTAAAAGVNVLRERLVQVDREDGVSGDDERPRDERLRDERPADPGPRGDRPWLAHDPEGLAADPVQEHTEALEMFKASVTQAPDAVCLSSFDGRLTRRDLRRDLPRTSA